jgi:hypothetical protein
MNLYHTAACNDSQLLASAEVTMIASVAPGTPAGSSARSARVTRSVGMVRTNVPYGPCGGNGCTDSPNGLRPSENRELLLSGGPPVACVPLTELVGRKRVAIRTANLGAGR